MSLIKLFTKSLNIISCVLFCASIAIACSCWIIDPPEAFENTKGVFIGKVVKTSGLINSYIDFKVEKSWKSIDTDEISVYQDTNCGMINFIEDETYLVYVYEEDGYFYTNFCTRTKKLSDANEDLIYLENKPTISLAPKFFTRNMKTGLITGVIVFICLGLGYVLMKFKGK